MGTLKISRKILEKSGRLFHGANKTAPNSTGLGEESQ
jgi:hypothetical protein